MQGHETRPLIAMTMGDPAGIGAEVSLKALLEPAVYAMCRPLVIGTLAVLEQMRDVLRSAQHLQPVVNPAEGCYAPGTVVVLDLSAEHPGPFPLGVAAQENGAAAVGLPARVSMMPSRTFASAPTSASSFRLAKIARASVNPALRGLG